MTKKTIQSLELSLMDTVAKSNVEGIVGNISEVTLDALTNDEFVSSIPIFGTIANLYRGTVSIRERLFMKRILMFLQPLDGAKEIEREKFVRELTDSAGTCSRAGQALILLIEKLDDLGKSEIVGRIYRARLEGEITLAAMHRFSYIVGRAFLDDLLELQGRKNGEELDSVRGQNLEVLGVAAISRWDVGAIGGGSQQGRVPSQRSRRTIRENCVQEKCITNRCIGRLPRRPFLLPQKQDHRMR